MICRRDPRVVPSGAKSKTAIQYEYSDYDDPSPSKSCLAPPNIGGNTKPTKVKQSKTKVPYTSAAGSDDQSSLNHKDGTSLLHKSNQITREWHMMDDFDEDESSLSSRGERYNLGEANGGKFTTPSSLLQFPVPIDRGHDAKRFSHGTNHKYDGEMEPQGVRGQEATGLYHKSTKPTQRSNHTSNKVPVRDFQNNEIVQLPETPPRTKDSTAGSRSGLSPIPESKQTSVSSSGVSRSNNTNNQNKSDTSSAAKMFRKSAPVNLDDSSFEDPLEHVQGIHAMAMEHVLRGEYDMALQAFLQVLEVYLQQYGKAHALTASAYHNLGTVHSKRASLLLDHTDHQRQCREQALLCFQAAARSARDASDLGPYHPNVAVSLVRIGFLLLQSRQYQNAVVTFGEALRIRVEHYGKIHALVANLYNNLGVCHMHLQEFHTGRQLLQEALEIQRQLLAEHPTINNNDTISTTAKLELADTLCNIGGLCLEWIRQQGPHAQHALDAEASFLEALEIRGKVLGPNHALTSQVRSLHDMIRSIPLPEHMAHLSPSPGPLQRQVIEDVYDRAASGNFDPFHNNFNLPSSDASRTSKSTLTNSTNPNSPPKKLRTNNALFSADESVLTAATLRSKEEMDMTEAVEENFLLQKQKLDLVSYSRTTLNKAASTQNERFALLNNAKAILKDPERYGEGPTTVATHKDLSYEEGLAPLGGSWSVTSASNNQERITPAILEHPSEHLPVIHKCAANFLNRGKNMEALHLLEIILECQKKRNGMTHEDVGSALHNVGICHLRMGEHYKALSAFEEATRLRQATLGRDSPQVAASLVKVGVCLLLLRRLEDSLWIFREALSVRKEALGNLHPLVARIYNNIGCVHVELKEMEEGMEAFESALEIQRNTMTHDPESGPVIFATANTLQNMAFWYQNQRKPGLVVSVLEESLALQEKVLGKSHPTVLATMDSLAEAYLATADIMSSIKYYKEVLERMDPTSGSSLQEATALYKISKVNFQNNDLDSQLSRLQMAQRVLQSDPSTLNSKARVDLERRITKDIEDSSEMLGSVAFDWV